MDWDVFSVVAAHDDERFGESDAFVCHRLLGRNFNISGFWTLDKFSKFKMSS